MNDFDDRVCFPKRKQKFINGNIKAATLKLVFPTRKKCSTFKYHVIFEEKVEHFFLVGNSNFNVARWNTY